IEIRVPRWPVKIGGLGEHAVDFGPSFRVSVEPLAVGHGLILALFAIRRTSHPFHTSRRLTKQAVVQHVVMKHMVPPGLDRELKKGSAELMILSLVEARARHGYEISRLIDERSGGRIRFKVASLYPMLYRLEARGWLEGRWIEKAGERRR